MSTVTAKKSFRDGHVSLTVKLHARGYGNDNVKMDGSTELTTEEARLLAKSLTELADQADARAVGKAEAKERRRKWRDREVASGRMKIFSANEFFL